jgi:hypothetical protein
MGVLEKGEDRLVGVEEEVQGGGEVVELRKGLVVV